ncbi:MAG TPA: lipopolysaccharide biosynthesis protein, partial [Rhizobiales bacterium]|nr:lipopolysaccharide biosynthesis protein [Hyphomicrobiales bacterium]
GWIDLALVPPYILRPILLFVYIGVAVLSGWARDAETAAWAAVLATWVTAFVQYILQKKRMATAVPPGERRYKFCFWLKVSLPVIAIESFALMMTNMDIILLKVYVTPDQIAIYFAAARTISLIAFVHFAVVAASTPKFSTLYATGQGGNLAAFFRQTRNWTFWPSLAGSIGLLVAGKPLLWMFGPEFTAAYPAMFILVIGFLARSLAGPLQGLMIATGRQNQAALAMGTAVVVNVGLNLVLIPGLGLIGAAIATASAFCVESVLLHFIARKLLAAPPAGTAVESPHGTPAE